MSFNCFEPYFLPCVFPPLNWTRNLIDWCSGRNMIAGVGFVSYAYSKKKGVYTSFYFQVRTKSKVQEWSGDRFLLTTGTRRSPFE